MRSLWPVGRDGLFVALHSFLDPPVARTEDPPKLPSPAVQPVAVPLNPLMTFGLEIAAPISRILVRFFNDNTKAITAMINDKTSKTADIQSGLIVFGMVCCGLLFVGNTLLVWYGVKAFTSAMSAASNVVSFCAFWAYLDGGSSNSSTNVKCPPTGATEKEVAP